MRGCNKSTVFAIVRVSLAGYTSPEVYVSNFNGTPIAGGASASPFQAFSFDNDAVDLKYRMFTNAATFSEDAIVWGQPDYWATPLESLGKRAGDCEDYVIGKYFSLLHLGVAGAQLRFIYVRARIGGAGSTQSVAHMVLGYYETPQSEPLVLDNMLNEILPARERPDLGPVFSFNAQGIYVPGKQPTSAERISRWPDLLARMQQEGFMP